MSCRLSFEYSSSVAKPINRKDVEKTDVNEKAAPTPPEYQFYDFPVIYFLCCLDYSLPRTWVGLVSGSVCGKTSPSRGQAALSTADSEEGKSAV